MKRMKKNEGKSSKQSGGSEDHGLVVLKYTQTDAYKYLKELQKHNKIKKINILLENSTINVGTNTHEVQSSNTNLKIEHMPHVNVNPALTKQLAYKVQISDTKKSESKNCAVYTFSHEACNPKRSPLEQSNRNTEIHEGITNSSNSKKKEKSLEPKTKGVSKLRNFLFDSNYQEDHGERQPAIEKQKNLKNSEVQTERPDISVRSHELTIDNKESCNGEMPRINQKHMEKRKEDSMLFMEQSVDAYATQKKEKELSTIAEENDVSTLSTLGDVTELNKDDTKSSNSISEEINEIQGLISEIEAMEREEVKMSNKDDSRHSESNKNIEIGIKRLIETDTRNDINQITDKINTNKELIILMSKNNYDNHVVENLRKIYSEMKINKVGNRDMEKLNNFEKKTSIDFCQKKEEHLHPNNEESRISEELSEGEIYVQSLGEIIICSSMENGQICDASKSDDNC